MSVSTHVVGLRDEGGRLREVADLVVRCRSLALKPPEEAIKFLGDGIYHTTVDEMVRASVDVDLKHDLKIDGLVDGDIEYGDGIFIDLSKLPADIKKIRIYQS